MSGKFEVFVSWSGELSCRAAGLLHTYMPRILQALDVFMSKEDIKSGTRWAEELARELETSEFGVLCLTPDNLESPWLLFEAGALTKHRTGRACGLLLAGLSERDVAGPLAAFQHRVFSEAGVAELMRELNARLASPLRDKDLEASLELWWPRLREDYDACLAACGASAVKPKRLEPLFSRVLPALPLPEATAQAMGDLVDALRSDCWQQVAALAPAGAEAGVRANVFLPDCRCQARGIAYELFMHPQLRSGMDREQEWDVRFAPREGATGLVFDEGRQRTVRRRDFLLTDRLKDSIHPALRWIVSTPVKGRQHDTLAVLNIDGIGFDLSPRQLDGLADFVAQRVGALGALLDAAPKRVVVIQSADAD